MSITIEEIEKIKNQAEQKRRSVERAKGSLQQLLKNLQNDFGCASIEEAKKKLAEMEQEGVKLDQRVEKLKDRLVSLWEQIDSASEN